MKYLWFFIMTSLMCMTANAGDVSVPSKILSIRPYIRNTYAYVQFYENVACDTSVFTIDVSLPNGKAAYAALLGAQLVGKKVAVEISDDTGCVGWGTSLQSVFVVDD